MLGWIEKVVPQPPVIPPAPVVVEKAPIPEPEPEPKPKSKSKEFKSGRSRKKLSKGSSSQSAGGSEKNLLPVVTPDPVTPDPVSTTESSGRGVLTWLTEGLGKVVPQPLQHGTAPQQDAKPTEAANQTQAQNVEKEGKRETTDPSGAEGKPDPSADNATEATAAKSVFSRLLEEFEKMIPQPEVKKPEEKPPEKSTAEQAEPPKESSPAKPEATHRASADSHSGLSVSLFPQTLGGDGGSGMFRRIIRGLEKAIPRPASKEKPAEQQPVEAGGSDPGQDRSKGA